VANRFKCGQKHDGKTKGGPNEWLAKEFDKLFTLYEGDRVKNDFAIRGYQKSRWRRLSDQVLTLNQLLEYCAVSLQTAPR
jgi:hypothetical protein